MINKKKVYTGALFFSNYREFASSICNKVAEMIQGLATPVDMKLKLIPVFQHMHHDASTAVKVIHIMMCSLTLQSYSIVTAYTYQMYAYISGEGYVYRYVKVLPSRRVCLHYVTHTVSIGSQVPATCPATGIIKFLTLHCGQKRGERLLLESLVY